MYLFFSRVVVGGGGVLVLLDILYCGSFFPLLRCFFKFLLWIFLEQRFRVLSSNTFLFFSFFFFPLILNFSFSFFFQVSTFFLWMDCLLLRVVGVFISSRAIVYTTAIAAQCGVGTMNRAVYLYSSGWCIHVISLALDTLSGWWSEVGGCDSGKGLSNTV